MRFNYEKGKPCSSNNWRHNSFVCFRTPGREAETKRWQGRKTLFLFLSCGALTGYARSNKYFPPVLQITQNADDGECYASLCQTAAASPRIFLLLFLKASSPINHPGCPRLQRRWKTVAIRDLISDLALSTLSHLPLTQWGQKKVRQSHSWYEKKNKAVSSLFSLSLSLGKLEKGHKVI